MKAIALSLGILAGLSAAHADELPFAKERIAWNKPFQPFHVIGNIYYVGMAGVSAFLIVTPQGDILTDAACRNPRPSSNSISRLWASGSAMSKILLNSHAHFDHSGGLAKLKADTGAQFYASRQDKPFLESGHITFGPSSQLDTTPIHVDHVVDEGSTVSLGGVTLTAHITPGHTKGCTTWTMPLNDNGVTRKVMFSAPSVSRAILWPATAPIRPSWRTTSKVSRGWIRWMRYLPCAPWRPVRLGRQAGEDGSGWTNPFVDSGELHRRLVPLKTGFDTELAKQRDAAKKP